MTEDSGSKRKQVDEDGELQEPDEMATLDRLFKNVGICGRFQVIFVSMGYFPFLPATWGFIFMTYGSFNPGWTCQDQTTYYPLNSSVLPAQNKHNLSEYRSTTSVCDARKSCNNLIFNEVASTVATEWSLVCDDTWILSLILSIQMIGVMLGSYAGGQLGDRLGRKVTIHGSCALLSIANLIAIFSVSWKMYIGMRFIIGFSCGGIFSSAAVYAMEFLPAWWRGFLGTFPFWSIGTTSFSLCAMALKNWKHIHIASSILALIAFLPVVWLPESLRFLTVHGKLKRANKVVRKIARLNRKTLPDTTILNIVAKQAKDNRIRNSNYSYLDLFHKNIRKTTIVLGLAWFVLSTGYLMVSFGLRSLSGDFFVNLLLFNVLPIPMRLIAMFAATKFGRRLVVATFICLSSICSLSVVAIQFLASEGSRDTATLIMALGTNMMLEAAWGSLVVLAVELAPTPVRNLSYGFYNVAARLGSVIGPYLIPKDMLPIYGAFLLLGVILLITSAALLTLKETLGMPLPDHMEKVVAPVAKVKPSTCTGI